MSVVGDWHGSCWVKLIRVGMVKVGLEKLGENVACVVFAANPPNSHPIFHIVLSNGMVAEVYGTAMFIHSRLSGNVFGSLVVRVQVEDRFGVAIEL